MLACVACSPEFETQCEDDSVCPREQYCVLSVGICTPIHGEQDSADLPEEGVGDIGPDTDAMQAEDAEVEDPPLRDSDVPDAATSDAAAPDEGMSDMRVDAPDALLPDADVPDMALPDVGIPDAELPDAELPDVGIPDAACPGAGQPDLCNGLDDDCDNRFDEDYVPPGEPCFAGIGLCRAEGELICLEGEQVCDAQAEEPGEDEVDATCNGVDEDCDGLVDEGYVSVEITCGVGVCRATGSIQCVDREQVNVCTPGDPSEELCNGLDDDCDGQPDEAPPEQLCPVNDLLNVASTECVAGEGLSQCEYTCDEGYYYELFEAPELGCPRGCGNATPTPGRVIPSAPIQDMSALAVDAANGLVAVAWIDDGDLYYWFDTPQGVSDAQQRLIIGSDAFTHVDVVVVGQQAVVVAVRSDGIIGNNHQVISLTLAPGTQDVGLPTEDNFFGTPRHLIATGATVDDNGVDLDVVTAFVLVDQYRELLDGDLGGRPEMLRTTITPGQGATNIEDMGLDHLRVDPDTPPPGVLWIDDRIELVTIHHDFTAEDAPQRTMRVFHRDGYGRPMEGRAPRITQVVFSDEVTPESSLSLWGRSGGPRQVSFRNPGLNRILTYTLTPNELGWAFTTSRLNPGEVELPTFHFGTASSDLQAFTRLENGMRFLTLRWLGDNMRSVGQRPIVSALPNAPFVGRIVTDSPSGGAGSDLLRVVWTESDPGQGGLFLRLGTFECP
ncbi:MAG: MopE-related protein [Bradymonadia bacterium]